MGETTNFDLGREEETSDPNKAVMEIYNRMRRLDKFNNLLNAIDAGGQTIVIQTYEMNKNDKDFPPEKLSEKDKKLSDDIVSLINEGGEILTNAAAEFKKIMARANRGEATGKDVEFSEQYEAMVQELYDKLIEKGYSHQEIAG